MSTLWKPRRQTTKRPGYYNDYKKWHKKTAVAETKLQSSVKDNQIIENIIKFLKQSKTPQKTLDIARACGYNTPKDINPTLYQIQDRLIVKKVQESPPLWALSPQAGEDFARNVTLPSKVVPPPTFQTPVHIPDAGNNFRFTNRGPGYFYPQKRGRGRARNVRENCRNGVKFDKNIADIKDSVIASSTQFKSGTISNEGKDNAQGQSSHASLFKKTQHDKDAPGAYKMQEYLGHCHEMRIETFDVHRKNSSPNFLQTISEQKEQEYLGHCHEMRIETFDVHRKNSPNFLQTISEQKEVIHENTNTVTIKQIKQIECKDKDDYDIVQQSCSSSSKYLADKSSFSLKDHNELTQVEISTDMPSLSNNDTNVVKMEDDADYTDDDVDDEDDDYDLNSRIFEVTSLSIHDLDNKNTFSELYSIKQNFTDSDTTCDEDEQFVTFEKSENDNEEVWVGDGYLGPDSGFQTLQPEIDICSNEKVKYLKLLDLLLEVPCNTTSKNEIASHLQMAHDDLQVILDTCCSEGWIDSSSINNYVTLTEAGKKHIIEQNMSTKSDSKVLIESRGPPPFPVQLIQNSLFSRQMLNTSQSKGYNGPAGLSDLNNSYDFIPVKEVLAKRDRLMPWVLKDTQLQSREAAAHSTTLGDFVNTQVPLLVQTPPLLPTPRKSSYKLHSQEDIKSTIPQAEAYSDYFKQNKLIPSSHLKPFLSLQENVQQKRSPLLSTPDFREASNTFRSSFGSGKLALLPFPGQPTYQQFHQHDPPANLQISTESFAALNKNPISAFMEYGQSRHTPARLEVLSQSGPPHKPVFTIAAVLGTRIFPGITSNNKKDGKKDAAEQAIRMLIAEGQYNMPANSSVMSIPESSMTQFDKIAALTHHKFNQLIAVIPESLVGRKVIAGLVMKMNDADTGTVVAIGSGNRCITGDKLSLRGQTLNDCHAEIITRRGFIRFLYHQLKSYNPNRFHPIFEKSSTGKLRIKQTVSFHLYISTAPCGDGALFSPRDVVSNNVTLTDESTRLHRPTFETNVQGLLRTKMEGGEGTIPLDPEKPVQTWDGIVRGERLRTMSCSDKLCRWNVVGLQGALLANFLDPVYLNSITLGFLFDAGHLSRAVCCRLNRGEPALDMELPFPYHLNHPVLGRVTACDPTRETQKTKSYSINWMVEDEKAEIVDGCQGTCYTGDKNESSQPSRLCKKSMFNYFHQTCQVLGQQDFMNASTYFMAKRMSTKFQKAKEAMIAKFKNTNCGIWLGKPPEEEMF